LDFLAKKHLQEMLSIWSLALLAFRPFGFNGQRTSAEMLLFGLWPYWPLGRLAFLAKEHLQRCCLFGLWPYCGFWPFGLFGQRTSAWDVVYLAFGPISLQAVWPFWSKNICKGCCLFGLWPYWPLGRLAFLAKEHLQEMLFI